MGHNFYQRAYNKQPFLFRNGANDGFHEAIGDSVALSTTPAYLKQLGLADSEPPAEADIPLQLRTALDKVAFLPFALALDTWRWQVFSGEIKPADYNRAWWDLRAKYQGVAPPVERTEADFDPGAKNHIRRTCPMRVTFWHVSTSSSSTRRCATPVGTRVAKPLQFLQIQGRGRPAERDVREGPVATMAADAQRDDGH